MQTQKFLTALPTRQNGVENSDKAYLLRENWKRHKYIL